MELHRNSFQQLPWSAETVYLKFPKKVSRRAGNLPTPIGRSKTPPRPLREALRIRMGKPGWESGYLFGRPLADGQGGTSCPGYGRLRKASSNTCETFGEFFFRKILVGGGVIFCFHAAFGWGDTTGPLWRKGRVLGLDLVEERTAAAIESSSERGGGALDFRLKCAKVPPFITRRIAP